MASNLALSNPLPPCGGGGLNGDRCPCLSARRTWLGDMAGGGCKCTGRGESGSSGRLWGKGDVGSAGRSEGEREMEIEGIGEAGSWGIINLDKGEMRPAP